MPDIHSIIVEIKPDQAVTGMGRVDGALEKTEQTARRVGKTIGEEYAKAAQEGVKAGEQLAREAAKAAKAQEAAAAKAARAVAASSREAARAQEEHARHVTAAVERAARQRAAAEVAASKRATDAAKQAAEVQKVAIDKLKATYREIVGPAADFARKVHEANQAMRAGGITAAQYDAHIKRLRGDLQQFNASRTTGGGGGGLGAIGGAAGIPIGPAAAVGAGIVAGKAALNFADDHANLTNSLRGVTAAQEDLTSAIFKGSQEEASLTRLREKLFQISQDNRVEWQTMSNVYASTARSAKNLGLNEAELLEFTDSLAKATRGASAAAKEGGLQQLGQALAAGVFQGDELKSVLENLPKVSLALQKSLGKTTAELREMGAAGTLTGKDIVAALAKARPDLIAEFGDASTTSAEGFTVLRNAITKAIGDFSEKTGLVQGLSEAVIGLANAMGGIATVAGPMTDALAKINDLTGGRASFFFGGGLAKLDNLSSRVLGDDLVKNVTSFTEAYNKLVASQTKALEKQTSAVYENLAAEARRQGLGIGSENKGFRTGYLAKTALGAFDDYEAYKAREDKKKLDKIYGRDSNGAARDAEQTLRAYEQLQAGLSSVYQAELQLANAEEVLAKAVRGGIATNQEAIAIREALGAKLKDQLAPFQAAIDKIAEETAALDLSDTARRRLASTMAIVNDLQGKGVTLSEAERAQLEAAVTWQDRKTKTLADEKAVIDAIRGPRERLNEQIATANTLMTNGAISAAEYAKYVKDIGPTPGSLERFEGFRDALADFAEASKEFTKIAEEAQVTIGDVLSDQLASGLTSGIDLFVDSINGAQVSFSDFARSVLADLEKMLIKFLLFQAIKATIGTADGGLGSVLAKGLGFAAGGDYTVPNNGRGTDGVPVHMRLSPGERVTVQTPGQQAQQGAGAAPTVNVRSVIVRDEAAAFREFSQGADNERTIISVIARNREKIRSALS